MGDLRQSVSQNGRVHLHIIDNFSGADGHFGNGNRRHCERGLFIPMEASGKTRLYCYLAKCSSKPLAIRGESDPPACEQQSYNVKGVLSLEESLESLQSPNSLESLSFVFHTLGDLWNLFSRVSRFSRVSKFSRVSRK